MRRLLLSLALALAASCGIVTPAIAQAAADSAIAHAVKVQTDSIRSGYSTYYAKLHRLANRIDSIAAARLAPATASAPQPPADTSTPPAPPSTPPTLPPSTPIGGIDTTGLRTLVTREFASIASSATDQAGAETWDPIEYQKCGGRCAVLRDASAPSGGTFLRITYPQGFPAGSAPALLQAPRANLALGAARVVVIDGWFRAGSNFSGNQSSTNKVFFVWQTWGSGSGNRTFISMEGAYMAPLYWTVRFQGKTGVVNPIARLPHVDRAAAAVKRGSWQHLRLVIAYGRPGMQDTRVRFYVDGTLVSTADDVDLVGAAEPATSSFSHYQVSPTFGGGGAGVPATTSLDIDDVHVRGK